MQSVSASAVDWRLYHPLKKKNAIQHSVSTHAGRKRYVAVACAQLQLDGHWQYSHLCFFFKLYLFSTEMEVCRYLDALASRLQVAVKLGVQPIATCSRLQRYKTPIRASDKQINAIMPFMWVESYWSTTCLLDGR